MKERPMLFSAPMVRAILKGQKTQTRRAMKPKNGQYIPPSKSADGPGWEQMLRSCPYGQPGDRIYVRETYAEHPRYAQIAFRADGEEFEDADGWLWVPTWRPSIHMPRAASRITLEVTGVRVERLNDISEADCWAEGTEEVMHDFDDASQCDMAKRLCCSIEDAKPLYAQLWEQINGPGSWDTNPWVWAVSFKRVTP